MALNKLTNEVILNGVRAQSSIEYQKRIPLATQGNIAATSKALSRYPTLYNEFQNNLMKLIGTRIARTKSWTNPLAVFKMGEDSFSWGVEEYLVGLLEAHDFSATHEYGEKAIFGTEVPEVKSFFHTVNSQRMYRLTIKEQILKSAFMNDSSPNSIAEYVSDLMTSQANSDNVDEFLLICERLKNHTANPEIARIKIPDAATITSSHDDAVKAFRTISATADNMQFMSTKFNPAKMPMFAEREKLVLITTPEFKAAIDIEALARLFNLSVVDTTMRVVTIPRDNFIGGTAQAIISTEDLFIIQDKFFEIRNADNPVSLGTNHFLHHHQVISNSMFAPIAVFSTDAPEASPVAINTIATVDSITGQLADGTTGTSVAAGQYISLSASVTMTDPQGVTAGVVWSVEGAKSPATNILPTGVLMVAPDETATSLTVTASSPYSSSVNKTQKITVTR